MGNHYSIYWRQRVARPFDEESTLLTIPSHSFSLEGLHNYLCHLIDWHPFDPKFRREAPRTGLAPRNIDRDGVVLRMEFPITEEAEVDSWLRILRYSAQGTPSYWKARKHRFGFNEKDWWPLRVRKTFRVCDDYPGHWALEIELGDKGYEVIELSRA